MPPHDRDALAVEFAEKYLAKLIEAFTSTSDQSPPSMFVLGLIAYKAKIVDEIVNNPAVLSGLLTRIENAEADSMTVSGLGTLIQLTATLLMHREDTEEVVEAPRKAEIVRKLTKWRKQYRGQFIATVSERCNGILIKDPVWVERARVVRKELEKEADPSKPHPHSLQCGWPPCGKTTRADGSPLLLCGRCKKVKYCGQEHQMTHWKAGHQAVCSPKKK